MKTSKPPAAPQFVSWYYSLKSFGKQKIDGTVSDGMSLCGDILSTGNEKRANS